MASSQPIMSPTFKVRRHEPELIVPAQETPRELKLLSDIDDQKSLRMQAPIIQFYNSNPLMQGINPALMIKEGIAKALVFYYPFGGRLREADAGKLMVDCTGEGVMFLEAHADFSIEQFGDPIYPPFPFLDELMYDVHGSSGILNSPLIFIQVTRLKCGGFIMALRHNHTMADAFGLVQFMYAIGEMTRGAAAPSILPVWDRHILFARDPPRVTRIHREYEEALDTESTLIERDMTYRSLFFGPAEIFAIRSLISMHLRKCTNFEIITAYLWKLRTIALKTKPEEEMRMMCNVNARGKRVNFDIPKGYYGNAFASPVAIATAKELIEKPLAFVVERVMEAKASVDSEYLKSVADFMVLNGRPPRYKSMQLLYKAADLTRVGFRDVNFGWGKAAYGGLASKLASGSSHYMPFKNKQGVDGIMIQMYLPAASMDRFVEQLDPILKHQQQFPMNKFIGSAL